MSKLAEIHEEIHGEWSSLLDSWQEAQAVWKDAVATQFAKRFLSQWEAEMPTFLSALESLEAELQDAQRELR
jgi:uncharacterized protein YukE